MKPITLKTTSVKREWCGDYMACSREHRLLDGRKTVATVIEQWGENGKGKRDNEPTFFDVQIAGKFLHLSSRVPMKLQANKKADEFPIRKATYVTAKQPGYWGNCSARFLKLENAISAAKLYVQSEKR